jgi:hypothetical protein
MGPMHCWGSLRPALRSPFGRFLGAWLLSLTGSSVFFALYPVLMHEVFGITPALSSLACALAVGLRLFPYALAGRWSHRLGPARVLQGALGVRLLGGWLAAQWGYLAAVGIAVVRLTLGLCLLLAATLLGRVRSGAGMPPKEQSVIES